MAQTGLAPLEHAAGAYTLTPSQQAYLDQADAFAREKLAPIAEEMDEHEAWVDGIFPWLGEAGYLGLTVPREEGGSGLDLWASALATQAIARWNPGVALSYIAHENLALNNIYRAGNAAQRAKYIPGLCNGSLAAAMAMTEPEAGSDAVGSMATTARRAGDHYILNGMKRYITNGPIADVLLVYAKTSPEQGSRGISAFVVESGFPGFEVNRKMIKMGFRGSQTGELRFNNCEVPAENLLGQENAGIGIMMSGLDLERATVAVIALGIAERAFELCLEYARSRVQFGKPIGAFQTTQFKLATMYTQLETMRTYCYRAVAAANDVGHDEGGRGEIHKLCASAILYAGDTVNQILNEALQIHGGTGLMWHSEINRLFRCIKLLEIGAGTTEVRKMIIAKELLGRL